MPENKINKEDIIEKKNINNSDLFSDANKDKVITATLPEQSEKSQYFFFPNFITD
jgi:hypothetical protein